MGGLVRHIDAPIDEITAKSLKAIDDVTRLDAAMKGLPNQIDIQTKHLIHAGVYMRTITMPAGCLLTGAQIKVNTTLIVSGDITLYVDGDPVEITGYHVLPAHAGRKQAVLAHAISDLTMVYRTDATTVAEAEKECTDDVEDLGTRRYDSDLVQITGI